MAAVVYALAARVWPGVDRRERDLQPDRPAVPVLERGRHGRARRSPACSGSAPAAAACSGARSPTPALGAAILAILLTQSRGALAAAAIGAIAWLAIVPLRLRSLPVMSCPRRGGAVAAWALSKDALLRRGRAAPSAKESVAGEFGLLLVLMGSRCCGGRRWP